MLGIESRYLISFASCVDKGPDLKILEEMTSKTRKWINYYEKCIKDWWELCKRFSNYKTLCSIICEDIIWKRRWLEKVI